MKPVTEYKGCLYHHGVHDFKQMKKKEKVGHINIQSISFVLKWDDDTCPLSAAGMLNECPWIPEFLLMLATLIQSQANETYEHINQSLQISASYDRTLIQLQGSNS